MGEMRASSVPCLVSLLLLVLLFGFSSLVNSQSSSDSCASNLNLNGLVSFETTNLVCHSVWDSQGFILRYSQTGGGGNIWSFLLSAPNTKAFVAIGFSSNGRMIGSSAVVGWVPNDGIGVIKQYFLGAENPNQVNPDQGNLQIVNNSMGIVSQSSRLYLSFQLNTSQPETRLIYSVGQTNIFPSSTTYRLMQHRDQVSTRLNYGSGKSSTETPYSKLRKTHGILNMIGWGILMLIGAMAARYFRNWDPIWFYSHASIQLVGFIIGASGVIAGFVLEDRLSAQVNTHKTIGIFILVLACLQVFAFLARPGIDSKARKYWNPYHHGVGGSVLILSVSNVFYGIHVANENNSWNVGYGLVFALLITTALVLEVRKWKK